MKKLINILIKKKNSKVSIHRKSNLLYDNVQIKKLGNSFPMKDIIHLIQYNEEK